MDGADAPRASAPAAGDASAVSAVSAAGDGGDWRSSIARAGRTKVVDRIIDRLNMCYRNNVPEALRAIATKVEEKHFAAATSQDDYLRKISLKLMSLEKKIQRDALNMTQRDASISPSASFLFSESQVPSNQEFGANTQGNNQGQLRAIAKAEQSPVNVPILPQKFQKNSPPGSAHRPINHTPIPAILGPNTPTVPGSQNSIVQSQVSNQGQPLPVPKVEQSPESTPFIPQNFQKNTDSMTAHGTGFSPNYNLWCGPVVGQSSPNRSLGQDEVLNSNTVRRPFQNSHFYANHINRQLPMQNIRHQSFLQSNMQQQLPREHFSLLPNQLQSPHQSFMEMTQPAIIQSDSHFNLRQSQVRQAIPSSIHEHLQSTSVGRQHQAPLNFDQLKSTSFQRQAISIPQNSIMPLHEQLIGHRSNVSNTQQRQLLGRQNRPLDFSDIHQKHQSPADNLGVTNAVPQLQTHQPSSALLESQSQQPRQQPSQQQLFSDIQTPTQMQRESVMCQQPDSLKQETHDPHSSDSVLQLQNIIEEKKQSIPSNAEIVVASSSLPVDTATQMENSGQLDWQEVIYQKIKSMKEMYFEELKNLHQNFSLLIQQNEGIILTTPQEERFNRLKQFKCVSEYCLKSLLVSKSRIDLAFRECFPKLERQISCLININRSRKIVPSQPASTSDPHNESSFTKLRHGNTVHAQPSEIASLPHSNNSSQQTNSLPQSSLNTLQTNISLLRPSASSQQNQHLKRQSQQQNTELLLQQQKRQQLSQQQFHQQHKQQQSPNLAIHQVPQSSNGEDEPEIRQCVGFKLRHCDNYHHHALNKSSSVPISTTQNQHAPMLPFPKADSSFCSPSLLVPRDPPTSKETEKINGASPLPGAANCEHYLTTVASHQAQPIATLGGISSSSVLSEFPNPDENKAPAIDEPDRPEKPMNRLIKAVQSMSSEGLCSSIDDMLGVVSPIYGIPGHISRASLGEDLAAITNRHLQDQLFSSHHGKKMSDSLNQSYSIVTSESESTASTSSKRQKIAASHALVGEIREINQQLIDTVLSISDEYKDLIDAASRGQEGTVIKLSFSAVSISPSLKSHLGSSQMSLIMPLRLLVPTDYPKCSPIVLDNLQVEESQGSGDLSTRMQSRFSMYLRDLPQPMPLREIAKSWDACARKVVEEYALQNGGGTFSSRFGGWQSCATA